MSEPTPTRLEPAFLFGEPGQFVVLADGDCSASIGGTTHQGHGQARLNMMPRPNVTIYCEFSCDISLGAMLECHSLSLIHFNHIFIEGLCVKYKATICESAPLVKISFQWVPSRQPVLYKGDDVTSMSNIIFHLFNFMEIEGTRYSSEKDGNCSMRIAHFDLLSGDWKMELRSLPSERFKKIREEGGAGLTHIGCLEHTDGRAFTGKDAQEMMVALRFFFTFAKGTWCGPVCPVGFDGAGERVWEEWSSPNDSGYSYLTWADANSCQLQNVFQKFIERWHEEGWHDALREVIYWYQNANESHRGLDAGIILTQAALERLSYEYAVKQRRLVETKGFQDLRASDKFRLLFSSLDIPIDLPSSVPKMKKMSQRFNWLDAPHALTEVRNSLVHPENKHRGHFHDVYFEAWNLGLWYLELTILRICDYTGTYVNRLGHNRYIGMLESVPWARKTESAGEKH